MWNVKIALERRSETTANEVESEMKKRDRGLQINVQLVFLKWPNQRVNAPITWIKQSDQITLITAFCMYVFMAEFVTYHLRCGRHTRNCSGDVVKFLPIYCSGTSHSVFKERISEAVARGATSTNRVFYG